MSAHTYDAWTYINRIYMVDTGVVVQHCCAGVRAEKMRTHDFQDLCWCLHFDLNGEEDREYGSKSVCFYEKVMLQATLKHDKKFSIVWVTFNTRRTELFYIASILLLTKADLLVDTYLQSLLVLVRNPSILVHPIIQGMLCLVPSHLLKCMFICTADRKTRPWMNQILNIVGSVHKRFINRLKDIFTNFMVCCQTETINSTYIDTLIVQVGREVCKLNMVDTTQCNSTGVWDEVKAQNKKVRVGSYISCLLKTQKYCFLLACGSTTTYLQWYLAITA